MNQYGKLEKTIYNNIKINRNKVMMHKKDGLILKNNSLEIFKEVVMGNKAGISNSQIYKEHIHLTKDKL